MADDITITVWQRDGLVDARIECPAYVTSESAFVDVEEAVLWANRELRDRDDPFKPYEA